MDLQIHKANVTADDGSVFVSTQTIYFPENEVVDVLFPKLLPISQNASLEIEFTGNHNDKLKGFYRSKYFTSTGEQRYGAVTQFAPTDARRCFPCWVR